MNGIFLRLSELKSHIVVEPNSVTILYFIGIVSHFCVCVIFSGYSSEHIGTNFCYIVGKPPPPPERYNFELTGGVVGGCG